MAVTILSGPSWVYLDANGRLSGLPPAAGVYNVTLQAQTGPFSATKVVSINVTPVQAQLAATLLVLADLGKIALSFDASVDYSPSSQDGLKIQLSFTANVDYAANFKIRLDFAVLGDAPRPVPGTADFNETNGAETTATLLQSGVASYNTLHNNLDEDYFKLVLPYASTIALSITNLTQAAGAVPGLYISIAPEDVSLSSSYNYTNVNYASLSDFLFTTAVFPAGVYYLYLSGAVTGASTDVYRTYDVKATWSTTPAGDANEPNYSPGTAKLISLGAGPLANTLPLLDTDWFRFVLPADGYVRVSLTGQTQQGGATPNMRLQFAKLRANLTSTDFVYTLPNRTTLDDIFYQPEFLYAGDYAVRVRSPQAYTAYSIDVASRTPLAQAGATDSFASPQTISSGTAVTTGLYSDPANNIYNTNDYYVFTAPVGTAVTIVVSVPANAWQGEAFPPSLQFSLRPSNNESSSIYGSSLQFPATSASSGAVTLTASNTGSYVVKVSGYVDQYTLLVSW